MSEFSETVEGMQDILAICPCCDEIFRLVEGKFVFPEKRPRQSPYADLVALEAGVGQEADRLDAAEERFEARIESERQRLTEQGRKQAKRRLKKIDPNFSAKNIDPQDVKALFHPVEFTIFHGLNSTQGVKAVEFVSRAPDSKAQEILVTSIERSITNGSVEFEVLRMRNDGTFDVRRS